MGESRLAHQTGRGCDSHTRGFPYPLGGGKGTSNRSFVDKKSQLCVCVFFQSHTNCLQEDFLTDVYSSGGGERRKGGERERRWITMCNDANATLAPSQSTLV